MGKPEIRALYDEIAPRYDMMEAIPEKLGVRRLRRRLLERARGRVLEVAVGTGSNLDHYPSTCRVTGLDLSRAMLERARRAAVASNRSLLPLQGDTERLPFRDGVFDTVVDTMTLCTYPDPVRALGELARVCRPDGRLLLLEHGLSDRRWLRWFQERRAEKHYRKAGCHWDRRPFDLVEGADLVVRHRERTFFGVFHLVEAGPPTGPRAGRPDRRGTRDPADSCSPGDGTPGLPP